MNKRITSKPRPESSQPQSLDFYFTRKLYSFRTHIVSSCIPRSGHQNNAHPITDFLLYLLI